MNVTPQKSKSGDWSKSGQKQQNHSESPPKTSSFKKYTDTPDRKKSVDVSLFTPEKHEEKGPELKVRPFRSYSEHFSIDLKPSKKSASDFIYG